MRAILIAAKHLAFAKTRLGRGVGDADRMALAEAMFRDVLAAALSARVADHVAVISSDPLLLEVAGAAGALVIDEEFPRGLNAAVRLASCALAGNGSRNNEFTSETAQYCIPQYDSSGVQRAPYC